MTAHELQTILASSDAPLLVQVLPEEVFAARRIPGSKQGCVYEVAFFDQIAALTTDKARAIIVYGAGSGSLDAQVAAQKLSAAGFTHVTAFDGGLDAWSAAGLPLDGEGTLPAAPSISGSSSNPQVDVGPDWNTLLRKLIHSDASAPLLG